MSVGCWLCVCVFYFTNTEKLWTEPRQAERKRVNEEGRVGKTSERQWVMKRNTGKEKK